MCLSHSSWFPHNWTASHNINWAWMSIPLPGRVDRFWLKLGQGMYFSWDFENWSLTPLKLRWKTSLSETPTCHLLDSQSNLVLPLHLTWATYPLLEPSGHPSSLFTWARVDLTCLYVKHRPMICAYTQSCYLDRVPTTLLMVSRTLALPFQKG